MKKSFIKVFVMSLMVISHAWYLSAAMLEDERIYADFDESMEFFKNDKDAKLRYEKKDWALVNFCRNLYKKNNLRDITLNDEPRIPKIIHIIWVGPLEPPAVFKKCLSSVQELLPDWECRVWTDKDIPGLNLRNQVYYDEETCYGAKADILRYELLERFGGLYLDIDFVLRKPLDILHHGYDFYTSMMPGNAPDVLANGVIGCVPGHPIIKACVDCIKEHRQVGHILGRTGPYYFQHVFYTVMKEHEYERVVALPKSYFLPFDYDFLSLSEDEKAQQIKPETFAIHYWANSWGASMPGAWADPAPKKK